MGRALKYTLVTVLAIVLVALGLVYGLYFAGARHISPEWQPTTARYSDPARFALWRSYGGYGAPEGNPMSPPEYAWRWYRAGRAHIDRSPVDPRMTMAYRAAQRASMVGGGSQGDHHLMQAAASIKASRWSVDSQLDTALDALYFGAETRGLRAGSQWIYGRAPETLGAVELDVLMVVAKAPAYYDPRCHPDRVRNHVLSLASQAERAGLPKRLDAALGAIGPAPAGHRCVGNPE